MLMENALLEKAEDNRFHFIDIYILLYLFVLIADYSGGYYLYITMGLYAILMVLIFKQMNFKIPVDKNTTIVLFIAIYIFFMGIPASGVMYSLKRTGAFLLQTSPMPILYYYTSVRKPSKRKLRIILLVSFLIFTFFSFVSFYAYNSLGVNARKIASKDIDYGNIAIGGGYYFAFALTLFAVYLLDIALKNSFQKKVIKYFAIAFVIWFGLVIYETLSTITFISYFIGVLIVVVSSIFFRRRTGLSSSIVQLLIIGMVVLLVVIFLNEIGEWILSIASNNSTTIGVRLKSLAYMLLGNDSGGLYSENRMYLPIVSLKTFLQNPLFGVAYKHGNGFYRPYLFGVANHCEWADTLANYGLVGGIPLLYIYFSNINKIYKNRTLSFGLVISFLILGMFNPFRCVQTSVVLFFLIPAINVYLNS